MKNHFKNYIVRYWDHSNEGLSKLINGEWIGGGYINDCFGNSHQILIRARNESEAATKAKKKVKDIFRLHSVEILKPSGKEIKV